MDRLYTTEEIAEVLNMAVTGVRKMAREGRLPAYRIGKHWRFDLKEVLEVTNVRKASEMVPTVREDAPGTFASGF